MHHQPGFGRIDPQLPGGITTHSDQQTIGELQIGRLGLDDIQLLLLQEELWERILAACALGGEPDGQYAATSLVQALEMGRWLALVEPILRAGSPSFL